ncbi:FMN-binding negative transcriptional regulator [Loktanella sp. S4079]|uniref:FMN-binding negative transcriptional regulator n=1 Tax=Loktanella sp. S4079 TaxID=579483 RepID=UPI0005F9C6CA|nr:FMN-binding negative transcriptional regulator [Loktanella sp. S4079]KJZ20207.1 transcriptional regulator [Loktanella sp. S4079]
MYIPTHFKETDSDVIREMVAEFPLATIVVQTADGLIANHIPVIFTKDDQLIGHIAIANDLHRVLSDGAEVLAIFQAHDAYISPNWYPSKAETHKAVPTWNYDVVHMRGKISFQHDNKSKRAVVGRLTLQHERATNGDQAWRMADAPPDFMADMLDRIVAFEIAVDHILAKSKRSQNRSPEDQKAVASQLEASGQQAFARKMRTDENES